MHTECRSTRVLSEYSRLAILVVAVLLSGCALFQPYRNVTAYPPDSKPQWKDINSAAQICRVHLDYPPLSIHAVKVDLQAQNLNIAVYPLAASEAGEGTSLSKKVSTFAKENHCFVAVNANPFAPSSAIEGELRTITGICVANGVAVSPPDERYAAALFGIDGPKTAKLVYQSEIDTSTLPWTHQGNSFGNAVGGFFFALKDGEVSIDRPGRTAASERHPRTALGVSKNGNTVILIVIDGRTSESVGATEEEVALWMRYFGANDAITLDGGGSSAMAILDGTVVLENIPVHGAAPGVERAVASCIGFMQEE